MLKAFRSVISEPTSGRWTGSFVFMHGSGGTGHDLQDDIKEGLHHDFNFSHIRVIFPTAPLQPYRLLGGALSNVWFDRSSLSPRGTECLSSINQMALQLKKMVQEEVDAGVPENRIVIGGFSMGASMALHLGLRFLPNVAGIVSSSTFLYNTSEIYTVLENEKSIRRPPVLMCHGDQDELIDLHWGKQTYKRLSELGADATFKTMPGLGHSLNSQVLDIVRSWVMEKVPDS
ncbi:unnamed protein product [Candidula unifasciata]|uniref:palmitoyl-protein hydrolase n=1 Tax=Candidula unifasciata TaxID=100452 RepID=A0A8S3YC02_9EUPU|nr:unnamed protein product [Candidula unifasciata]